MAFNFPNNPGTIDPDVCVNLETGVTYKWLPWPREQWVFKATNAGQIIVGEDPPSPPQQGDLWIDCKTMQLYAYVNDGNSMQWVAAYNGGVSVHDHQVIS